MTKEGLKYRRKEIITAYAFKEGMEDGFVKRYYDDDDVQEDGTIQTSGFMGEHSLDVPFILDGARQVLTGKNYVVFTKESGDVNSVPAQMFHGIYEPVERSYTEQQLLLAVKYACGMQKAEDYSMAANKLLDEVTAVSDRELRVLANLYMVEDKDLVKLTIQDLHEYFEENK